MTGGVRRIDGHDCETLVRGWEYCRAEPAGWGDSVTPELPGAGAAWRPVEALGPVAAVLRASGEWRIDGEPRRFDAEDHWYRLRLTRPSLAPGERAVLLFEGLATLAQVWVNRRPAFASSNMFLAHEWDVSEVAGPEFELLLRFASLDAALAQRRPRPRWRAPMIENQQLRWFRTTLLGRMPGWSPPAAPVGPWRGVSLERRSAIELRSLSLRSTLHGRNGGVHLRVDLAALDMGTVASVRCTVERAGHACAADELSPAEGTAWAATLTLPEVCLWWPHTHGEPALYDVRLEVTLQGSVRPVGIDLGQIGFRTVVLDQQGGRFRLIINGMPVFCRGACWTPPDVADPGAAAADLRPVLERVRDAGMNMLRVPGNTVYADEAFFDACDALGLLVWQDFMFANMDYPESDAAFTASVTSEVRQVLARLQARPSLAVLCGNSEAEQQAAMWGAGRDSWSPPLFHELIATLAAQACPDVPYWPSSAHGGAFPHQWNQGTTSYYGVGAYLRPLEDARRSEVSFATECLAFANIPEERALARHPGGPGVRVHQPDWKRRTPRDLGAGWDFDDVRDDYLRRLYEVDPLRLRYSDHDRYLALSRAVTGEVMAAAFGEWRRAGSTCGGALVWFLRDLWAGAGWGLLDDAGDPKACFYALRRALQPLAVILSDEGGSGLEVHVVNELPVPRLLKLELRGYRADGETSFCADRALRVSPQSRSHFPAAECLDGFTDLSWAYRFGPAVHQVVLARLTDESGADVARSFHFPLGLAGFPAVDLGLAARWRPITAGDVEVELHTERFAQSVHWDVQGFIPDDAWFHLEPQGRRLVRFRRQPAHDASAPFRGSVTALNARASVAMQAF